jgi:hypothetical protein
MQARRTLAPGQKGTKRLLERYGAKLVCVRYRYDEQKQRRYKTVELIVEEAAWKPSAARVKKQAVVGVRVGLKEVELQRQMKQAGGRWNPERRLWEIRYDRALELGLKGRIESDEVSNIRHRESFYNSSLNGLTSNSGSVAYQVKEVSYGLASRY